jgi:hypothetical protein
MWTQQHLYRDAMVQKPSNRTQRRKTRRFSNAKLSFIKQADAAADEAFGGQWDALLASRIGMIDFILWGFVLAGLEGTQLQKTKKKGGVVIIWRFYSRKLVIKTK